ncbi:hypothetical protein H6503_05495 [Candidatus Woesearchaeota archaeon]|nr:hypothetical protein [Candidatus Woesearchaeota archaeon]
MGRYIDAFLEGYRISSAISEVMRTYRKPCDASHAALAAAGVTKEAWDRLDLGKDKTLEGMMYSMGGFASWLVSDIPN